MIAEVLTYFKLIANFLTHFLMIFENLIHVAHEVDNPEFINLQVKFKTDLSVYQLHYSSNQSERRLLTILWDVRLCFRLFRLLKVR